ncbi:enoyl-CoA hydratase/isomerase family protein [Phenylobacterium sp.]|jgi:enoyl-CoA hydratase|uniref:enoyl-CoA hydratase/isomerase family protein n=1 Tax=Phenylobacterium sp. TaxID=1871053 RepID=UPI0037CA82A7
MSDEIWVGREGGLGRLTLNRPQALHALTTVMCSTCITVLSDWRRDPAVQAVLIDHSGERGFCAGGDIRMLADSGADDGRLAREFFFTEYRLNHLLFSYPKPVIAVMDGITMGGGVGLSAPARYRLATERTTFAMPETGIGLFPDVGGGWFLPRLPGRIGLWLALTGARIKAADCLHAGLATHYVPSERLPALKAELAENFKDIEPLLAKYHVDPGPAPLLAHRAELDAAFGQGSVEAILAALEAGSDWAQAQALALRTKSPQTLKVAFRQLALGAAAPDFAANMAMEYRIGARVVQRHDFLEGVRAVIVDKDNAPKWNPARLEDVGEDLLDAIFAPLPADQEWSPLERTPQ